MADDTAIERNLTLQSEGLLNVFLDHPELTAYFHTETHAERYPLQLVDQTGQTLIAPNADAGGVSATLIAPGQVPDPDRVALTVELVAITETDVTLGFQFPVEGVRGTVVMTADAPGNWSVADFTLVEG